MYPILSLIFALSGHVWEDIRAISRLDVEGVASLTGSVCPGTCRYDRTSKGDIRYHRVVGDESVIFESFVPGVVTRIWMTQGSGVSVPLDSDVDIRITLDGQVVLQVPLPVFFSGTEAPFDAPLVGDRLTSAGGNFCYVPMPFRKSCRIGLVGALDRKIWYQVNVREISKVDHSFSMADAFPHWAHVLGEPMVDPFDGRGTWASSQLTLDPSGRDSVGISNTDVVNGLRIQDSAELRACWIRIRCDDFVSADLPVRDFFACQNAISGGARSVMVGGDGTWLYAFWPMPFDRQWAIEIYDREGLSSGFTAALEYRSLGMPKHPQDGFFRVERRMETQTPVGQGFTSLDITGRGVLVGQFLELEGSSWEILEGDEQIDVDGVSDWLGTGVEDFFNGGFYFRVQPGSPQPFQRALHGLAYAQGGATKRAGMMRVLASDAIPFRRSLKVQFEAGSTQNMSLTGRAVSYLYLSPSGRQQGESQMSWWDAVSERSFLVDENGDGVISTQEAAAVSGHLELCGLADDALVSQFVNACELTLRDFSGDSLDLSALDQLRSLNLERGANLTQIVLNPQTTELEMVDCPMLDVLPEAPQLRRLSLRQLPNLTTLTVSDFPLLQELSCDDLGLGSMEVTAHESLRSLKLQQCANLSVLGLAHLSRLTSMTADQLPQLLSFTATHLQQLVRLELTDLALLNELSLVQLPAVKNLLVRQCPQLHELNLEQTGILLLELDKVPLESLSLPDPCGLDLLRINGHRLDQLDVSSCQGLQHLDLTQGWTQELLVPDSLVVLKAPSNRLVESPDLSLGSLLDLVDLADNELTELSGVVSNAHLLNEEVDTVLVNDNRLFDVCDQIQDLVARREGAQSLLRIDPQMWSYTDWPMVNIRYMVGVPQTVICSP